MLVHAVAVFVTSHKSSVERKVVDVRIVNEGPFSLVGSTTPILVLDSSSTVTILYSPRPPPVNIRGNG